MFKPATANEGVKKKSKSKVIDVEFELVTPCEAYFHTVRALLN